MQSCFRFASILEPSFAAMATLTIKNVPNELYEQLKHTARAHSRSINSETIVCLKRALNHVQHDEEALMARIRNLRAEFPSQLTEEQRTRAVNEGRA